MKKNRYILCLLLGGLLLYYAVPRFSIFSEGAEGIFTISWLILALLVIAGNLTAILYSPKRIKSKGNLRKTEKRVQYGD
ncbi:hypothetical protein ACFSO7_20405 [Bacillus sp. CGMCC 1.16607]|uniref:hypothetical protein n=1 Tax=Bacillus sp. CGMCC 1.16607 TaxID=3351842 RepID=UPI003644B637